MEKQQQTDYEARIQKLLRDQDEIYQAMVDAPFMKRKTVEAARQVSQLKPPFPWEKDISQDKS